MEQNETEIRSRIKDLEDRLLATQREVRSLEGKIRNRTMADPKPTLDECLRLENRVKKLRQLLAACFAESVKGATEPEAYYQSENLRISAVDYFKRTQVDIEIWKNIVS